MAVTRPPLLVTCHALLEADDTPSLTRLATCHKLLGTTANT